jgi:AraC-like DNA-binding protein
LYGRSKSQPDKTTRQGSEVALAAGFADQAHFTRMFKAAFGLTPARYGALSAQDGDTGRAGFQPSQVLAET